MAVGNPARVGNQWRTVRTRTEVDGDAIDDKEQVLGIGPGAHVSFGPNHHLFLNAYWETAAENRPEGQRFVARYVHHF